MRTLLKGGTVVSGSGQKRSDVLMEGEKIVQLGKDLSGADQTVDVTGCLLFILAIVLAVEGCMTIFGKKKNTAAK